MLCLFFYLSADKCNRVVGIITRKDLVEVEIEEEKDNGEVFVVVVGRRRRCSIFRIRIGASSCSCFHAFDHLHYCPSGIGGAPRRQRWKWARVRSYDHAKATQDIHIISERPYHKRFDLSSLSLSLPLSVACVCVHSYLCKQTGRQYSIFDEDFYPAGDGPVDSSLSSASGGSASLASSLVVGPHPPQTTRQHPVVKEDEEEEEEFVDEGDLEDR